VRSSIALVAALSLAIAAQAQEADLTLPKGAPAYTPVAPVHVYTPDFDVSSPEADPGNWGGPDNLPQQVSMDVDTSGVTALDFVAAILDRDPDDNLYVKVQGQSFNGKFSHIGFYHGAGSSGWPGMTGGVAFLALAAGDQFTSARMTVTHDGAGNVTLRLTNVVGGNNNQVYVRGGWTPREAASAGLGGFTGNYRMDNWGVAFTGDAVCDNFNRANGGLGGDWVTTDGTATINGNRATGSGTSRSYFIGACGVVQRVEADVSVVGTNSGYGAVVFNWDGVDNAFVKVQQQDGAGTFGHVGFYHGKNEGAWPGQTGGGGFFAIPATMRFQTAHMTATIDNSGAVRLVLTNLDGGANEFLEYQRGGWSILGGNGIGIGGWTGDNIMDNVAINGSTICDNFNRPNGPLGPNWTADGPGGIVSNAARLGRPPGGFPLDQTRALFTGVCGGCNDTTPPTVEIDAPASFACDCSPIQITGTAIDGDGTYVGDRLEYRRSDVAAWTTAAVSAVPRVGVLYNWAVPGALTEGWYFLRVVGENDCGLSASDTTVVRISRVFDSAVLRSPSNGNILGGRVCFDGTADDNACFRNYTLMYRPAGVGAYAPVDPGTPVYGSAVQNDPLGTWITSSGPTAVPDGDYDVRLRGTDDCGNIADEVRTITVDNTSPISVINSPVDCDYVDGVVQITGTANDANLSGWTLQYSGGGSGGWVTINTGNAPVINGVLGNWNTNALPICAYTLRLVVSDRSVVNCGPSTHQREDHVSVNVGFLCDINQDGAVDAFDIEPFINCLLSP
jgi:hypothetical protein